MLTENYVIDRINDLCQQQNLSHYRLAKLSGISQSSISNLLNRKSTPSIHTLERLCTGFGITLSQFFMQDNENIELTCEQKALIIEWNGLQEGDKKLVKAFINGLKHKV